MSKFRLVFAIAMREVKDQFRDWRITSPIIFLTGVFPFLVGYVSGEVVDFVRGYDANIIAEHLIPFFMLVVGFFPVTISLVIASESFVGEKERRSIEPLLTSPLEDWELYLWKLAAVMAPPLLGAFIGMTVYMLMVVDTFGIVMDVPLLLLAVCLTISQAFVMVSAAVVISVFSTTVRSANLLSSFIVVPMAFLIQWEAVTMFWGDYLDLWWIVLGLVVLSILFTRLGVSHFNREELLSQEFDSLNLRWLAGLFWESFKGGAQTIGDWYRKELASAVKQISRSILVMSGLFIGAWILGIILAGIFEVPVEWVQLEDGRFGFGQEQQLLALVSGETITMLWFHNLRAMMLGSAAGILTFGVLGVLILLLPMAIISYLMQPMMAAGVPAWKFLLGLVIPHGLFEIPAIILLGGAVLHVGVSLVTPNKGESILDGLVRSLGVWAKIMIGLVLPLMLIAATFEALVTPRLAVWLFSF
ncbi:MAG: stage II sporulation protein M [Anaerolineales bacterium]|nr:stage II sporulation protein M [Anaerolineales bacterium]